MKILMIIGSDSELICYEAVALAFLLASFDHQLQLYLSGVSHKVLGDSSSRLYGMIQSLSLYDIPKAWTDFAPNTQQALDELIKQQLTNAPNALSAGISADLVASMTDVTDQTTWLKDADGDATSWVGIVRSHGFESVLVF